MDMFSEQEPKKNERKKMRRDLWCWNYLCTALYGHLRLGTATPYPYPIPNPGQLQFIRVSGAILYKGDTSYVSQNKIAFLTNPQHW